MNRSQSWLMLSGQTTVDAPESVDVIASKEEVMGPEKSKPSVEAPMVF